MIMFPPPASSKVSVAILEFVWGRDRFPAKLAWLFKVCSKFCLAHEFWRVKELNEWELFTVVLFSAGGGIENRENTHFCYFLQMRGKDFDVTFSELSFEG